MTPRVTDLPASTPAVFRYQVVCSVLADIAGGLKRAKAVRRVAKDEWWNGEAIERVSKRTVYRWLAAYEKGGIRALEPAKRTRTTTSEVLSASLLRFLEEQKEIDVEASIPEILDRARELDIIKSGEQVDRVTVWRAARRMGIAVEKRKTARGRDARRYRYPHKMQLVLCDGKHFRAGAARLRRVVFFYLDNATRSGLHAVVGTSESAELFLRGLYETVACHGLFDIIYLDHGAGFIAKDVARVVEKLERLLIHGAKKYPEAHGSVERFNRTAKARLLRHLTRPDVDPSCRALELRIQHYVREVYGHQPHEAFGGEQSPWQRWDADPRELRMPASDAELRAKFLLNLTRRVSNDNVVSYESVAYEVPRGHRGESVTLYRQVLDGGLSIVHDGQLVRIHPVDLAANAAAHRATRTHTSEAPSDQPLPPSAADMAYNRDFAPVVDPDGGYSDDQE